MDELRRDPILGQWVIVQSEEDSLGPDAFHKVDQVKKHKSTCPFCPGKEYLTPHEVDSVRDGGANDTPAWKVRVVPNKFPALKIEGTIDERREGILQRCNGIGAHEIVIDSPSHEKDMADFSEEEMVNVLDKYQSRILDLAKDKRFRYIVVFKNFGESAGTSIEHSHSQIIALPMIPKYVLAELEGTKNYFDLHNKCLFCDILEQENKEQERVIGQNEHYINFCPFVPRYPFENWIIPKKHSPRFELILTKEKQNLARIMIETLKRLKVSLGNPSYNFFLHTSPVNYEEPKSYHWHIEIVPQLAVVSGFEWATGLYVVPTSPAVAAKYLRSVKL